MLTGPLGAFAIVAFELLAGTFLLMLATSLVWQSISRGHLRATTWVLMPLAAAASFLVDGRVRTGGIVFAALMLLFGLAVVSQRPLLEWLAGSAAALSAFFVVATVGFEICQLPCASGVVHAAVGTLFLGAVTHGMVLGHWYLNQPRLPIEPLKAATIWLFASLLASLLLGLMARGDLTGGLVRTGLFPFTAESFWWVWFALLVSTAGLGVMIRQTVWIRSTQSATGLLYIAMVPALGAQFIISLLAIR